MTAHVRGLLSLVCAVHFAAGAGCSRSDRDAQQSAPAPASGTLERASDVPIDGVTREQVRAFHEGDAIFDLPFREADGLGPHFMRRACSACHEEGSRGSGLVQTMVVVGADGVTPAGDQSLLPYGHRVRLGLAAGAETPLSPPADPRVKVAVRIGPPVLGRGYMEAVLDSEIERVAAEQAGRADGIHGTVSRVVYESEPNPEALDDHHKGDTVIGRFGLKARIATLDEFTADAFQSDMGLTTPMRPTELANPDALEDDLREDVDLDIDHVNKVADYLRLIAIPRRVGLADTGRQLFERAHCSVCHVPSMKTRADYPVSQIAGGDAPIYTDMLLHDLGDDLADGMTDGAAGPRQWRTAPLIGLRFQRMYLHDGRASTVDEAILAHGGEAEISVAAFRALSQAEKLELVDYVQAL